MKGKIKKIFLNSRINSFLFSPSSSKGFLPIIGAVVISLIVALWPTLSGVAASIIEAIAAILIALIAHLLDIVYGVLTWIISPGFLGVSMTGPDNVFVYGGWSFVRDLANIFLILGLIIIALGIILGFEEYRAKKTLPVLIIIALLINFTPVICGFIIDFSNNLMSHLLKGGLDKGFVNAINDGLKDAQSKKGALNQLTAALIFIIFGLVSIVVIALYCILFLLRYIFLWILIIFSPIAFASKVFGENRYIKMFFPGFLHWDNWWSQFIQWCIIGIFGAFFLFLTNNLMVSIASGQMIPSIGGATWLGSLFMYLFPILLLLIGFFATIEAAQSGMAVVPGMGKVLGTMAKVTAKSAIWAGKKTGEAIPEKVKEWGQRQARYMPSTALYGKGEAGLKGWVKRRAGQVATTIASPYTFARRGVGEVFSVASSGQMDDAVQTIGKLDGKSTEQVLEAYKTASTRGEKTGALYTLTQKHDMDDARAMMGDKERKQFDKSVKKDMGEAAMVSRDLFMPIARALPHDVDEVVGKLNPEIRKKMLLPEKDELVERGFINKKGDKKGEASYGRYVISGIQPKHVGAMDAEVLFGSREERQLNKVIENWDKTDWADTPEDNKLKEEIQERKNKGENKGDLEKELDKTRQPREEIWGQILKSWGGGHHEEALKTFKRPYSDKIMKEIQEKGMLLHTIENPYSAAYTTSIFATEGGMYAPGGVTTADVEAWREGLNKFKPEETKGLQDALKDAPDDATEEQKKQQIQMRKDLTQCLRIDPNRIEELRGEDAETIEGKIEEWKKEWEKGRAAEASDEEAEIEKFEAEIEKEEAKERPDLGTFANKERIGKLKARIRKLKQRQADQSSDRDVEIEIPFVKPSPKPTPTPSPSAAAEPSPKEEPSTAAGAPGTGTETPTPTPAFTPTEEKGGRLELSEKNFSSAYKEVETYNPTMPNYFKRQSEGWTKIIENSKKQGIDEETLAHIKSAAIKDRKGMVDTMTRKEHVDIYYDNPGQDKGRQEDINIETYIHNIKKAKVRVEEVKDRLEGTDKKLTEEVKKGDIHIDLFADDWRRAASFMKQAEESRNPGEKQVYFATALQILGRIENGLKDEGMKEALRKRL